MSEPAVRDVLVTGASGAIGGELVARLLRSGARVRCLVRDPSRLSAPWRDDVEVVRGDAGDPRAVARAGRGCELAYYLVHGLDGPLSTLVERERATASAFRAGVARTSVRRIVYLGGLVDDERLHVASEHLYARYQSGQELRLGPVPVTELRAGIVLSPASASVRLVAAAARVPLQVWGGWAGSRVQPIALEDLLRVLIEVASDAHAQGAVLDVGGREVRTYEQLVDEARSILGLRPQPTVRVSALPVELAATAAATLTGLSSRLVLALLQSVADDAVVRDPSASERYGHLMDTPLEVALERALAPAI